MRCRACSSEELQPGVYELRARFGFMETPDVGEALRSARRQGMKHLRRGLLFLPRLAPGACTAAARAGGNQVARLRVPAAAQRAGRGILPHADTRRGGAGDRHRDMSEHARRDSCANYVLRARDARGCRVAMSRSLARHMSSCAAHVHENLCAFPSPEIPYGEAALRANRLLTTLSMPVRLRCSPVVRRQRPCLTSAPLAMLVAGEEGGLVWTQVFIRGAARRAPCMRLRTRRYRRSFPDRLPLESTIHSKTRNTREP